MYKQIHVNLKSFKPINLTSDYVSGITTAYFRNKLYIIHNFCLAIVYNFKAGMKLSYYSLCLLKDVRFLSMLFLTPLFCVHIMPYYKSLSCSHI